MERLYMLRKLNNDTFFKIIKRKFEYTSFYWDERVKIHIHVY
jgi:hypothetical protein